MTKVKRQTIPVQMAFDEWYKDPEYKAELAVLEDEFTIADQFIKARSLAGLTQQEVAERMQTSQSYIARLEGGKQKPSIRTLNRFAKATGHRVVSNLEPLVS